MRGGCFSSAFGISENVAYLCCAKSNNLYYDVFETNFLFARGCGDLYGVIGGCFLLGKRGRIGCRGWRTLVFDGVRFLGNFSDFFETGLLWLKKYWYLAVGFGA